MRKIWTRAVGVAFVVAAFGVPAHAAFQIQSWIGIDDSSGDHRCIQPAEGLSSWNGTVITLQPCDPYDASSLWDEEVIVGGAGPWWLVRYRNVATGLCLDLKDGNISNGTPLQLWECNNIESEAWSIDANHDDKQLLSWIARKAAADCITAFPPCHTRATVMDVRGGSSTPGTAIQNYRLSNLPDGSINRAQWWRYLQR